MSRPAFRLEGADPWAGDSWHPDLPSNHGNHLRYSHALLNEPSEYAEEDSRFLEHYFAILQGEDRWTLLEESAHRLGIQGPAGHDSRPAPLAPAPVTDGILCDLLENEVPDLVPTALDHVLGPFADTSPSPRLMLAAVAAVSHSTRVDKGHSAIRRWHRSQTAAPSTLRRGVRCLERIPAMLWRCSGEGLLEPMLPLASAYRPQVPIDLQPTPLTGGGATRAVVARLLPLEDGRWVGIGVIGLPAAPPTTALKRRLHVELLRQRRHERRSNWEDLLRQQPDVLYRWCSAWTWHITQES